MTPTELDRLARRIGVPIPQPAYDVHLEWGVRRPDGHIAAMPSEDIARRFVTGRTEHGFAVVARAVAHMPWTADLDAALADVDRLRRGGTPPQL